MCWACCRRRWASRTTDHNTDYARRNTEGESKADYHTLAYRKYSFHKTNEFLESKFGQVSAHLVNINSREQFIRPVIYTHTSTFLFQFLKRWSAKKSYVWRVSWPANTPTNGPVPLPLNGKPGIRSWCRQQNIKKTNICVYIYICIYINTYHQANSGTVVLRLFPKLMSGTRLHIEFRKFSRDAISPPWSLAFLEIFK